MTINNTYFNDIIRFCFYTGNKAANGSNAVILFTNIDGTPWSIVFSNSFTSDSDLTYSLAQNSPAVFPTQNNWLPQANINAKLTVPPSAHRHNAINSLRNNENDYTSDLL